jgi:hypothetical protein
MPCWYFYDSLLFLRSTLTCPSYRLGDVFSYVLNEEFEETHTALKDAIGLHRILQRVPPNGGFMYPKYLTPLQNIKWVGTSTEAKFVEAKVRSVESLLVKYMEWVQVSGKTLESTIVLMQQFLTHFNLPCRDLSSIATEMVEHWLPDVYGGQSSGGLF